MSSFNDKLVYEQLDHELLFEELDNCHIFKYIAFKHLNFPFRHTGFLLYFDNVPKYTINVRPESDNWQQYLRSVIGVSAKVTVESADHLGDVSFVGRPVVHVIESDGDREAARRDLRNLLTEKSWYSLLFDNCRDHVRGVMRRLNDDHPGLEASGRPQMQEVVREDFFIFAMIGVIIAVPLAILFKK